MWARTLLEGLKTLKGDLELVLIGELGGVVQNLDAQKLNDRHCGGGGCCVCLVLVGDGKRRPESDGNEVVAKVAKAGIRRQGR